MIYARTNKQMDQIDSLCKKRIIQARQSSKQELNDAIKKISQQYKEYYEHELHTMMKKRKESRVANNFTNLQAGDLLRNVVIS